jgi:hypothetical protein
MNLDIEKIKAALLLAHKELAYLEAGVPTSVLTFEAVDKTREALAALEAYDPDAIRRECYLSAKLAVEDSQYDGSGYYQVDMLKLEAAIMNAGKE